MRPLPGPVLLKRLMAMLAVVSALFASEAALAASRICRDLEAELARVQRGSANPSQMRRFQSAIAEQQRELRRARTQARRIGCDSAGFVLFGRNAFDDRCTPVTETIDRMELNLARLENKLAGLSGARAEASRNAILARIEAYGCRMPQRNVRRLPDPIETTARRDYNLMDRLFGDRLPHNRRDGDSGFIFPGDDGGLQRVGTYRTLCVRTCDGYYFPISFSTAGDLLARDEQICRQMCPGVDVQLYSHRVPDEEPEDMISIAGVPYTELPAAFAYRDPNFQTPPGCACNPAKDYAVIAGEGRAAEDEEGQAIYIPTPRPRPDPGLDPESTQNVAGGLTADGIKVLLRPRPVAGKSTYKRQIRVVGPAFLPDPEEAIDLKSPARNAVR